MSSDYTLTDKKSEKNSGLVITILIAKTDNAT